MSFGNRLIRAGVTSVAVESDRSFSGVAMKSGSRWPIYLLLAAFVALSARLAWTLTGSKLGWQPQLKQWADAAGGLVGIESTPLSDQNPKEQAEFWLKEVAQVRSAQSDPQIALGAAWMLDAPQFGFIKRHVRMKEEMDPTFAPPEWRRELDRETIAALEAEFETLCRQECLSSIQTAVRLDSDNLNLWRARALLIFPSKYMNGLELEPRESDWSAILDECAAHDPDNALYDYLAALQLWSSSSDYDWEDDGYVLNIDDDDTFQRGNARFSAGLTRPFLKFGSADYPATLAFLDRTSLPRFDHLTAAASRLSDLRAQSVLGELMTWQSVHSNVALREERFDAALTAFRNALRIAGQVVPAGNSYGLSMFPLFLRQWSLANLDDLHKKHPNLLTGADAADVASEFAEAQLDVKIMDEVGKRMADDAAEIKRANSRMAFGWVTAQLLVLVTLALAIIAAIVARISAVAANDNHRAMGWCRHLVAWIGGFAISFVVLGMFPSGLVSPQIQTWLICGLCWIGIAIPVWWVLAVIRKRFRVFWHQLVILTAVAAMPIILAMNYSAIRDRAIGAAATLHPIASTSLILLLAAACWVTISILITFIDGDIQSRRAKWAICGLVLLLAAVAVPSGTALASLLSNGFESELRVSPTVWAEAKDIHIGPVELQSALKMERSKWLWAFVQWHIYDGYIVAPLIAVGLLLVWHLTRQVRAHPGGFREILRTQKRKQMRATARVIARSCAVASLIFGLVYLALTPPIAVSAENYYRRHYDRMANPDKTWDEIHTTISEIKADRPTMARLNAEIAERNRKIEQQRRGDER